MKKIALLLAVLMFVFTGCAGNVKNDPSKPLAGTTIYVYNWGDYIAEDTIERFTKETGIKVIYETFDSNETMYAKYKSGAVNYDVLIPSDYMMRIDCGNELLPLNFDNIPNAKYIDESFRNWVMTRKTSILCHISGELSEFFTTKKWCRRKLTPGIFCGTASTRVKL